MLLILYVYIWFVYDVYIWLYIIFILFITIY